jgi:hypothetical protein
VGDLVETTLCGQEVIVRIPERFSRLCVKENKLLLVTNVNAVNARAGGGPYADEKILVGGVKQHRVSSMS